MPGGQKPQRARRRGAFGVTRAGLCVLEGAEKRCSEALRGVFRRAKGRKVSDDDTLEVADGATEHRGRRGKNESFGGALDQAGTVG